jgi:glycosyltransferase involved in cell wall biosynthesis
MTNDRRGESRGEIGSSLSISEASAPLISIITPVFNGASYLRETIESVLNQTYPHVQYIVVDGGSTDGTVEIIKAFGNRIDTFISEPDNGMYDALAKGLELARGDVIAYLNAGDYYHPAALSVVAEIMGKHSVPWLTGMRVFYNENSQVIHCDLPNVYRRSLIRSGVYGGMLPFIQQESTFWKRELLELVDISRLRQMRLAGDYYLWYCFASRYDLAVVNSYLGGFKYHANQLSWNARDYRQEQLAFCDRLRAWQYPRILLEALLWFLPPRLKKGKQIFRFEHVSGSWVNQ